MYKKIGTYRHVISKFGSKKYVLSSFCCVIFTFAGHIPRFHHWQRLWKDLSNNKIEENYTYTVVKADILLYTKPPTPFWKNSYQINIQIFDSTSLAEFPSDGKGLRELRVIMVAPSEMVYLFIFCSLQNKN